MFENLFVAKHKNNKRFEKKKGFKTNWIPKRFCNARGTPTTN